MKCKDKNQSPRLLLKKLLCKTTTPKWIEWKSLWTLTDLKLTLTQETHMLKNLPEGVSILCHQRGQGWLIILAILTTHPRRLRRVLRWACRILGYLDKEASTHRQLSDQVRALEIRELKTITVNISLIYLAIITNIIKSHSTTISWTKNRWRFRRSLEERNVPMLRALSLWAPAGIPLQMFTCSQRRHNILRSPQITLNLEIVMLDINRRNIINKKLKITCS